MPVRRLPVRPDLEQLHRQAKELLRAIHAGDADAIAELREHHPESIDPSAAKLADAQLVLARSYGASSWTQARPRRAARGRDLARRRRRGPRAHHAQSGADPRARPDSHRQQLGPADDVRGEPWPRRASSVSCTATAPRTSKSAAGRAALQGKADTVRMIYELAGRPSLEKLTLAGPAYTLSVEGTAVLFALGARVVGPDGVDRNTMEHLLGTDSRNPPAKHRILEMYVEHGFEPPDTPVMALHRGRIDLLEAHLARDPDLLTRTFDIADIFPLAPACSREPYTAQGTPRARNDAPAHRRLLRRAGDRGVAARPGHGSGRAGGDRRRRLRRLHRALLDGRLPAQLLGQLRQGTAGRSALHAPAARPRRRPERPRVASGTPRRGTRRRTAARVPGRDAARLGRAVSTRRSS